MADTNDKRLELRLPAALKAEIEAEAERRGMNAAQLLRWLYRRWADAGHPSDIAPPK